MSETFEFFSALRKNAVLYQQFVNFLDREQKSLMKQLTDFEQTNNIRVCAYLQGKYAVFCHLLHLCENADNIKNMLDTLKKLDEESKT